MLQTMGTFYSWLSETDSQSFVNSYVPTQIYLTPPPLYDQLKNKNRYTITRDSIIFIFQIINLIENNKQRDTFKTVYREVTQWNLKMWPL